MVRQQLKGGQIKSINGTKWCQWNKIQDRLYINQRNNQSFMEILHWHIRNYNIHFVTLCFLSYRGLQNPTIKSQEKKHNSFFSLGEVFPCKETKSSSSLFKTYKWSDGN